MNTVQKAFTKHAVSKTDFDAKTKKLETANSKIADLKKANGDNEALQNKIGEYEK